MVAAAAPVDRLYAVDFSRAVDRAAARLRPFPRAHCIQADLAHLPLRDGIADTTYCLGVLHHLVNPDDGLRQLVRTTRDRGWLLLYLYYALDQRPAFYRWLLRLVTGVRLFTSRMPKRVMHVLAVVIGVSVYLPLARLARTVERLAGARAAALVPLHHYARHSVRFLIADAFDRFATPVEHRYTREQIATWLRTYGLETTFSETSPYWVALATSASVDARSGTPTV